MLRSPPCGATLARELSEEIAILEFVLKALLAGCVVALASWLTGRSPALAGFLVALPISTALVLPMAYLEHGDVQDVALLARSIAVAIPMTLCFFVPFFVVERFQLGFWFAYGLAFLCLGLAFGLHRFVMTTFFTDLG